MAGFLRAVVLGGAASVFEDLERLRTIAGSLDDWIVVATNDAAALYEGRVDHFVTMHPDKLLQWRPIRQRRGGNMDFTVWGKAGPARATVDCPLPERELTGSSGMIAARRVALWYLRATHVVLCGAPMDGSKYVDGAIARDRRRGWSSFGTFRPAWLEWIEQHPDEAACVRSMSGWTMEQLGEPTCEWLQVGRESVACA